MIRGKKGIILHPVTWIVVAFIIGVLAMYLVGKGIIPVNGINFCSK